MSHWAAQFWGDLKNSTDAGLLGVARFLGLLYGPIDPRLPIGQALGKALRYRLAPQVGWRHALGGIAYLLFILLVLTGVLLSVHYRPSAQEAYPSLQHIVSEVTLGWLIRDLHVWSANLVVVEANRPDLLAHELAHYFQVVYWGMTENDSRDTLERQATAVEEHFRSEERMSDGRRDSSR